MSNEEISRDPLNSLWRFFTSVRLTVFLLLTLAVTSIIGTVIPQNQSPSEYMRAFGPVLYRLFEVLNLFDMYHSWWFQLLLILLTLNIIVCSVDRLSATWKIIFPTHPRFNPSRFKNSKQKEKFNDLRTPDELKQDFQAIISRKYSYHHTESTAEGFYLYAEKWRWSRLGVYIVHISVIFLLVGGLIGSIFGLEGHVNIPEGEAIDTIQLRNTSRAHKLDFKIQCDDFNVSFYPNGAPKEFLSKLTILEDGQPVYKKDIIVNDPLRYKGINIFQSSYGELPAQISQSGAPTSFVLNFTSKKTGTVHRQKAVIGQPVEIPEDLGQLTIEQYRPNFNFRGTELGGTLFGTLRQPDGSTVEVILPLRFPSFDKMGAMFNKERSDAVFISVAEHDAQMIQSEKRYYTGLQVTRDPGVWVVYSGFIMMILGCIVTFFMSHQQVFIEVTTVDGKSRIAVNGTANKFKTGMRQKVKLLSERLSGQSTQ